MHHLHHGSYNDLEPNQVDESIMHGTFILVLTEILKKNIFFNHWHNILQTIYFITTILFSFNGFLCLGSLVDDQ